MLPEKNVTYSQHVKTLWITPCQLGNVVESFHLSAQTNMYNRSIICITYLSWHNNDIYILQFIADLLFISFTNFVKLRRQGCPSRNTTRGVFFVSQILCNNDANVTEYIKILHIHAIKHKALISMLCPLLDFYYIRKIWHRKISLH